MHCRELLASDQQPINITSFSVPKLHNVARCTASELAEAALSVVVVEVNVQVHTIGKIHAHYMASKVMQRVAPHAQLQECKLKSNLAS